MERRRRSTRLDYSACCCSSYSCCSCWCCCCCYCWHSHFSAVIFISTWTAQERVRFGACQLQFQPLFLFLLWIFLPQLLARTWQPLSVPPPSSLPHSPCTLGMRLELSFPFFVCTRTVHVHLSQSFNTLWNKRERTNKRKRNLKCSLNRNWYKVLSYSCCYLTRGILYFRIIN